MDRVEVVLAKLGIKESWRRHDSIYARCPNREHEDRNPSWAIRNAKFRNGLHRCYSCGVAGNLVTLVAYVRKLEFEQAQKWLTENNALELEPEPMAGGARVEVQAIQRRGFALPAEIILFEPFSKWPSPAARYLGETRHVTDEQVDRWALGYAVVGRLAGRVVVPVWGPLGQHEQLIAYSYMARSFADDPKRYLYPTTAEHPDFDMMWGEMHWPWVRAQRKRSVVIVTEGAFDALAVERAIGESSKVFEAALGGSTAASVRISHVAKLSSFGGILVLTDNDEAGDRYAAEIEAQARRHVITMERVLLAPKTDADSIPRETLRRSLCPALDRMFRML
jgi:DNA primase